MSEILALKDVTFYYKRKKDKLMILEHAEVSFERGKLYVLLGKSGVGKSTTLSLLGGLDEPKDGKLLYDGKELKTRHYDKYRRECVGMVFQDYCLLSYFTGVQNVLEGMTIAGKVRDKDYAYEILENMGIRRDTAGEIIELFQKLAHEEGICVIVVTHMRRMAEKADEVIVLENKSFFTS